MELDNSAPEESAEELFDSAPCGYLTTSMDGLIVRVNQTFLDMTGYSREQLVGAKRFKDLLTVAGRIYFDTHVAPLLAMQSRVREVAFEIACPGRNALPILVNLMRKDRAEQPALIRIMVFDATARRQYERELLAAQRRAEQAIETERAAREESDRANRAKDEFLALVSHELRTPLSAILGWTQLLRKQSAAHPEIERGLEVIERNTRLQSRLVDDLLDMGRVVSGKIRLDVQQIGLGSVLEGALETTRPAATARGIRLQSILDPGVQVSGDPGRLQQVFWNLLSNAIKFTPKGGHVQIVMKRVNSHIEISVADTGQGMPPELISHVFERYRQSLSASTRQTGGLGLGLSIVKTLVEMHGGTVEAHSEGEGHGSQFVVKLPVLVLRSESEPEVHPQAVFASDRAVSVVIDLTGIKVLLADDDPDTREILSQVLSEHGAEIEAVGSAAEALRAIQQFYPHVLVSDIGMPGEDGYELIRKVRMLGEVGATPAIALTAMSRLEDRTRALLAGFQMHLAKPVEPAELLVNVASLAGRVTRLSIPQMASRQ